MSKRLGILLSGRGSNFIAIADAIAAGKLKAEIAVVLSNRADAPGLALAEKRGIPTFTVSGPARDQALIEQLEKHKVDLVCLAGYMRLLSAPVIAHFRNRILNIHPSLLPAFPGLDSQHQALAHGVKFTGCTVHFVDEGLDSGPIVRQAVVPILDDDTDDTLSARILKEEHRIYSEAIALIVSGRYRIAGRTVVEV
ncbi:MAG: phosphoribosylglycinamide formyltransferase [Bryobacteraceae bacterium]